MNWLANSAFKSSICTSRYRPTNMPGNNATVLLKDLRPLFPVPSVNTRLFGAEAKLSCLQIAIVAHDHVKQHDPRFFALDPIGHTRKKSATMIAHPFHKWGCRKSNASAFCERGRFQIRIKKAPFSCTEQFFICSSSRNKVSLRGI